MLIRTVENQGKLFLIGPRRFGKSSLLYAVTIIVERESNAVVLREDAERYERHLRPVHRTLVACPIHRSASPNSRAKSGA